MPPVKAVRQSEQSKSTNVFHRFIYAVGSLFSFTYGFFILLVFIIRSQLSNRRFLVMDRDDRAQLASARNQLWNLAKEPLGMKHAFCRLRNSMKLHYVYSRPPNLKSSSLVIFLHGFPDSWFIWHNYLTSNNLRDAATLVAVDLPGYGGSDDLDIYDADHVLEAVAEFIIRMRDMFAVGSSLDDGAPPVIIVGHDWGACIGFRLAAQAPLLADRFILSNGPYAPHIKSNVSRRLQTSRRMIATWLHNPLNTRPLYHILPSIKPIFRQLVKSCYIFCFTLPWPLPLIVGKLGAHWMFRMTNAVAEYEETKSPVLGAHGWDLLASSLGPGVAELSTSLQTEERIKDPLIHTEDDYIYPQCVRQRAASGGFMEKIKFYRHNLWNSPWSKSLQLVWELNRIEQAHSSSFSGASSTSDQIRRRSSSAFKAMGAAPEGSINAATTIVWGANDQALDHNLCVEGISEYLTVKGSHLVVLPSVGHWTPLSRVASGIWEVIIEWAIKGEQGTLQDALVDYPSAKITITT